MPKIIKNVKEDLLTEGKKQLLSNGYLNLNIRNITKECNIGTGTFYNYFKNKEQLVIDILSNDWTSILKISNEIIEEDISFKEKLIFISNNINDFLKNYRLIFSEMAKHTSKNHYVIEPIDEVTLKKAGASGIMKLDGKNVQVIMGTLADPLASQMKKLL